MIVLDTHVWVWWVSNPAKIPKASARALDKADRIGIPAISVWEIALKASSGKLKLKHPVDLWLELALACDPRLELAPLLPSISIRAATMSWDHHDPADRFIVATAAIHQAALITADERIRDSGQVRCVWD